MNNISLGRYVPYDSKIHKLDPRLKLISLIMLLTSIFITFDVGDVLGNVWMGALIHGIVAVIILILMIISHVGIGTLFKQLKPLWIMMILITIINIFVLSDDSLGHFVIPLWNNKTWTIYYKAIYQSIYIIIRLILMVGLTMILTATTKPLDLTYALEWYMAPLKLIKFPVHIIAMTISIALRFIPTLLDETTRIMKAQASRGVDFEHGHIKEKIRAIVSLIVPLFLSAFKRSEELANAMESRGYDPDATRTRYRIMKWHFRDTICLILCTLLLGGIITLSVTHINVISIIGGLFV